VDFAGPLEGGQMLLILVDAHSKWIEVFPTRSSTSAVVIDNLRRVFSQFGLPEVLVSDNGSAFVSEEFNKFLLKNGVKQ
jgi:transposase InsO family protein